MYQFIDGERRRGTSSDHDRSGRPLLRRGVRRDPARLPQRRGSRRAGRAARLRRLVRHHPGRARRDPRTASPPALASRAEEFARGRVAARRASRSGSPREFDVPGTVDNVAFFAGAARNLEGKAAGEYSGDHTSLDPPRGDRRRRLHRAVELPAADGRLEDPPGDRRRQHHRAQAGRAHAAHLADASPRRRPRPASPTACVNVVTGTGPEAGEPLVAHPDVAMVSFTGSTAVGQARRCSSAAGNGQAGAPRARRQGALRRLRRRRPRGRRPRRRRRLAHQHRAGLHRRHPRLRAAPAVRRLRRRRRRRSWASVRLGDPFDPATDLGPLISTRQQEHVAGFVDRARAAGAKVVSGGGIPGGDLARGAYYEPTLVVDAAQDSRRSSRTRCSARCWSCCRSTPTTRACALANDTPYGLAASAWTRDVYRSLRATREIQAGCVWVNDHIPIISEMPHGGYKAVRLRQGHVPVLLRRVHAGQARHVRPHRYGAEALAQNDLHPSLTGCAHLARTRQPPACRCGAQDVKKSRRTGARTSSAAP